MIEKEMKCRGIIEDGKVIEMIVEIEDGEEMLFEFQNNVGKISIMTFSTHGYIRKVSTNIYKKIAKKL